ncbi:rRNA maturation RNase YbeY [Albidovulum aquaemixtae]|nr:rRNA maturation RNase YbeY [Defluviimonas aquaemixtae]
MEPLVDILIEEPRWQDLGIERIADRAARATLDALGLGAEGFMISLLACSDARIAELNAGFRDKPQPTNVLSWPSEERGAVAAGGPPAALSPGAPEMPVELGDIAIACEICEREAAEQGKTLEDHVTHLIVHGILHLLGYDHVREGDARLMEAAEIGILAKLGVTDPYETNDATTA